MLRLLSILLLALVALPARAQELRVAAASDLKFVLEEIAAAFERDQGTKVRLTFGSSGLLYSQIANGAPYDVFLSADEEYPAALARAGAAESLTRYGEGALVLWAPPGSGPPLARGFEALLDPRVRRIAIANPQHAPYGRAAVAALERAGVYARVRAKLVYGENISQAAQFVQSGNAEIGIIALALALAPPLRDGARWPVPAGMHPPLHQAVVVVSSSPRQAQARAFVDFLQQPAARALLRRYGLLPEEKR